jgi:hypothetical protein
MSIKATILSIVQKLQTIEVQNQDGADTLLHSNFWNNDLEDLRSGNATFPVPCCLVETILDNNIMIGSYNSGKDATIKLHIIHENYNNEGGLDANLLVFDLNMPIRLLYGLRGIMLLRLLVKTRIHVPYIYSVSLL